MIYSTYLGGSGGDRAYDVAVDSSDNAYVAGWTASSNFPINAPVQAVNRGSNGDAFISAVNECGCYLIFSTYLGGSVGSETARGIALDGALSVYITGDTNSTDFPTATPLQATRSGSIGTDAFVAKVTSTPVLNPPTDFIVTSVVGSVVTVTWRAPATGSPPTGYVLEGGVTPGGVLASLPTTGTATTYSFAAPTGAFFLRMHSLAAGARSVASNEVNALRQRAGAAFGTGQLSGTRRRPIAGAGMDEHRRRRGAHGSRRRCDRVTRGLARHPRVGDILRSRA